MEKYLFTSESVSDGHPDKVCDQISDAILDACIEQDPASRVAIETLVKGNKVVVAGELTTDADIDIPTIARETIAIIGYEDRDGFSAGTADIDVLVTKQSKDICQGVSEGAGLHCDQGAGDQGLMFGFAVNETDELLPLPIVLAHKLLLKLRDLRRDGTLSYARPDAKSQVTVEYVDGKPSRIDTVLISTQHTEDVAHSTIEQDVIEKVIKPICDEWVDAETKFYVNPTGRFVVGGPVADAGLTGRKIIVDTYGGAGRHGGGAFSGKDPSKVDRSAAYAARYAAKNIVAAGLADKCEVQLAYAIGVAKPVSVHVNCFGTEKVDHKLIESLVSRYFPLSPKEIVEQLELKKPHYLHTASYGHFYSHEHVYPWEKTDKVELLRDAANAVLKLQTLE